MTAENFTSEPNAITNLFNAATRIEEIQNRMKILAGLLSEAASSIVLSDKEEVYTFTERAILLTNLLRDEINDLAGVGDATYGIARKMIQRTEEKPKQAE